jgi:hypothetical protein
VPSYLSKTPTTRRLRAGRRTITAATAAVAGSALALSGLALTPAGAGTLAASSSAAAAVSAAAAPSNVAVARYGAGYLAAQIATNGGYVTGFGVGPDLSSTAYAVLALHAAGVGRAASDQAIGYLRSQVATGLSGFDGTDDPGRIGYVILAAESAGQDPRHFGGTAAENDLVARLLATSRSSGTDAGLFGAGDPKFDGSYRQGTALAALAAAGVPKAAVASNIAWLTRQQCANGFWSSYRADTAAPCPPVDLVNFTGPDTNSTSLAVQGLAAYHSHPLKALVLKTFKQIQSSDGGFPFFAKRRQASDPNSTALSIQALLAEGVAGSLPGYRVAGTTPYAALAAYQLGCGDAAADRGAFFALGVRSANVFATVQSVPALMKATLPLPASTPKASIPTMPCPAAAPAVAARSVAARSVAARPSAAAQASAVALAGTAGACPTKTTGVTVAVDFTAFPGGTVQVRCAPGKPATGVAALQQAGFTPAGTAAYGLAFICRINSLPSTTQQACVTTPPVNAYWGYYHANKGATTWTYSPTGASSYKPAQGSIEAWAFGNSAKPSKTPAQVRKITH